MIKKIKIVVILLFVIDINNIYLSQNQAKIWHFGSNTGLDFNFIPPTPIIGPTNNPDNSTTISDKYGNLLFSSNGTTVWNKLGAVMPNGSGLISHSSAGQCALIVPIPCSNKYVIFTNTEFVSPGYLNYTIVDMDLMSGMGDVDIIHKNISLGSGWTEKYCAIYNSIGNYYWVLTHKWSNDSFVAIKVDATGVTTTSVTTNIGSVHNCGSYGGAHDAMGQLTISKDGSKVINALTCQDKFELFDFNINTGVLSNLISIPSSGGNAWGTAFSADSKKLYVNTIFGRDVFQYDLSTYTSSAIVASKFLLYSSSVSGYNFGYMELGPDNKLYISRPYKNYLSVVHSPNNLGALSNFSYDGLSLGSYASTWGISRIAYNIPSSSDSLYPILTTSNISCFGLNNGSATLTPVGFGSYNYLWSPGGYTTSAVGGLNPGNYSVSISGFSCNFSIKTFTISEPTEINILNTNYTICENSTFTISPNITGGIPTYTVNWGLGPINTPSISVTPSISTVYNFTITDSHNCIKNDSIAISIESTIADFDFFQKNCKSQLSFTNTSLHSSSAYWNFGNGNSSVASNTVTNTYLTPGTYTVSLSIISDNGCKDSVQKIVTVNSNSMNLDFMFSNNSKPCSKIDSLVFINNSTGATSYIWNFGDGTFSNQINPTHLFSNGNYNISLIGINTECIDTITKNINVNSNISISSHVFPNVFTPNGDKSNDVFDFTKIYSCGDFTFEIYNRWGQKLFDSVNSKQKSWDGKLTNGEIVSDGTYFYIIKSSIGEKLQGTVTVFR